MDELNECQMCALKEKLTIQVHELDAKHNVNENKKHLKAILI